MPSAHGQYETIRDDFFSTRQGPLEDIRLAGTICAACGEPSLGSVASCQNCQGTQLRPVTLSNEGVLFSYTVVRNRPPGDYKGPDNPFVPFPVGLVELPEGIRVLSPLDCEIDALRIGTPFVLDVFELYRNDEDAPVLSYRFRPASGGSR